MEIYTSKFEMSKYQMQYCIFHIYLFIIYKYIKIRHLLDILQTIGSLVYFP
jgi:hypothetical protein